MSESALHAPFAGWFDTLDAVTDPVFAGRMMGDGFAIDPVEGVLRAPADAIVTNVAAGRHAVTLALTDGPALLLHIGLETVALRGAGFTVLVTDGQAVRTGDPLIKFDLDVVARGAKDLVTPLVLPGPGVAIRLDRPGRMVVAGERVAWVTSVGSEPGNEQRQVPTAEAMHRAIVVDAAHGLHARPAARIVALLAPFAAEVELTLGDRRADARSPVALLALGAGKGDVLDARARGDDGDAALAALERFAAERFGDPDSDDSPSPPAPALPGGGICASPGLAIGHVVTLRLDAIEVAEEGAGVVHETVALDAALDAVEAKPATGIGAGIAEAHRAILRDPALRRDAQERIAAGRSAGSAWQAALAGAIAALQRTGDARLRERAADLRDLERQVLLALSGTVAKLPALAPDTILLAEDLLPSQFLALDIERLAGICTAAGGPTAHVAILAAAAGIPMIVAAGARVLEAPDGETAILDADAARLILAPDAALLAAASARITAADTIRRDALREAQERAVTVDGTHIAVFANLGSVDDAAAAVATGAEGCGLLRTEFLFLDRKRAPDEAEQRALYARIAATLGDRPLIVRTLDIGGDKPVPYLPFAAEPNPALGQRGVRLSLARPDLLETQLRAIVAGVPGAQCRIMLPMVVDAAELAAVRAMLDAAMIHVGRSAPVELGVMIETPAAALLAGQLAEHADFLSVGTNDLTQYTLAADRGNAAVAAMVDALHPAVLRLIRTAADGAALHGRWLGVCGGLASDPKVAALLVGLGVTELSSVPAAVPAVKAAVRKIAMARARDLAERALAARSAAEVRALIEEDAA